MVGAIDTPPRSALPPHAEDAAAVARAKLDPREFAPLYARYFDPIFRYCYSRVGTPEAAADAASQVFAQALAALPSCRGTAFRSWLFAIAHNVLVDRYRGRSDDRPLEDAALVEDAASSPEDLALAAEQHRAVLLLLDRLPPDQRRVVELRLAGLTTVEIAAALGRSRGAIDTAQCRAVARLRALLDVGDRAGEERHAAR